MTSLIVFMSTFMLLAFMYSMTPLTMTASIATQSIMIALLTIMLTKMSWFAFILLMVFLSGMMIIFAYISSLASNEFINMPMWVAPPIMLMTLTTASMLMLAFKYPISLNHQIIQNSNYNPANMMSAHSIYMEHSSMMTLTLITYLLVTLLVVVKNSTLFKGPLRNMN